WLSERSARLYEPSVELLFMGAADCMRRRALRPIDDAIADIARPRIFDVACGSGGFLAQLGRAFPGAHLGGCDLSKSYVGRARQRLAHDGIDADVVVENAEALPLKDDLVDVVSCVFLFHELPREVRRRVAAEMLRVLKPGGTVVVVDAAQQHATPTLAALLDTFPATYHEPYFRSYQHDPLEEVLGDVGFDVTQTQGAFLSRVVVGVKPGARVDPRATT
ncbi:MAG TPA: class I SAM-dependent methyltransferase, partial [Myxococcota bacterium]